MHLGSGVTRREFLASGVAAGASLAAAGCAGAAPASDAADLINFLRSL